MRVQAALLGIALLLFTACATSGGSGRSSSSSRVLDTETIEAYEGHSTLLLIQSLRPRWLSQRGRGSVSLSEAVQVYVDGMKRGGPAALDRIHPRDVLRIEYLDGRAATTRYGTGHPNGAILVRLR